MDCMIFPLSVRTIPPPSPGQIFQKPSKYIEDIPLHPSPNGQLPSCSSLTLLTLKKSIISFTNSSLCPSIHLLIMQFFSSNNGSVKKFLFHKQNIFLQIFVGLIYIVLFQRLNNSVMVVYAGMCDHRTSQVIKLCISPGAG